MKRELYIIRIIMAIIISSIIFTTLFSVAYYFSYLNNQKISARSNIIEEQIRQIENLENNIDCNNNSLVESAKILEDVSKKIVLLEDRFGKLDQRVLDQKERYMELQSRHLNIINKVNSICNNSFTTILFFYSNNEEWKDQSERTGFILSNFKKNNPAKIMIYSFDYDLNSTVKDNMGKKFSNLGPGKIIVNEKEILSINYIRDLDKYLA